MELLHVYLAADGAELFTLDLSAETRPQLIAKRPDGTVEIAVSPTAGNAVIGALVRNEDGWLLASSSLEHPVVCGPKSLPNVQLLAGMNCAIGEFMFCLERDEVASGGVIIWRYQDSKPVMDQVVAGRNVVGIVPGEDKRPAVNPPISDEDLFEFFPVTDGIDVVSGLGDDRQRLQVGAGTLFSCNGFEGMYFSAKDGAEAIKSANPFKWPSRWLRRKIVLAVAVLLAIFAAAVVIQFRVSYLNGLLSQPRGAVQVDVPNKLFEPGSGTEDDARLVLYSFLRSMPTILTAQPTQASLDIINMASHQRFAKDQTVQRLLKFVKDVRNIQECAASMRWDELKKAISVVDREVCTMADADQYLEDAREMCVYASYTLPERFLAASAVGAVDPSTIGSPELEAKYISFTNRNVFARSDFFKREIDSNNERWDAMCAYVAARNVLMSNGKASVSSIRNLGDTYVRMRDLYHETPFEAISKREQSVVAEISKKLAAQIIAAHKKNANGFDLAKLEAIAQLCEQIGIGDGSLAEWKALARTAHKRMDEFYRGNYQKYRLLTVEDPVAAKKILDEMIELGGVNNSFYKWAVRERQRLESASKAKAQKGKNQEASK